MTINKRREWLRFAPVLLLLTGCRHAVNSPPRAAAAGTLATVSVPVSYAPLPLNLDRDTLTRSLLDSLQKRVMGRRESLRDIERVVREIGPIVAEAARQPGAQNGLQILANQSGVSLDAMRARWIALQEADLLLEAGGNADAVSPSNAVGVAQWLAATGQRNGLIVRIAESNRLTNKIGLLKWKTAWAEYVLRPDAEPNAPGNPGYDRAKAAKQLPNLRAELEMLRAKRRRVDERYSPRAAIFAQTRYLLRIAPRFPAADWLFQAYHGGEGGVTRTLKDFLGAAWPGSASSAILSGNGGRPLAFEDLYFAATPRSHPDAFSYLYGRSDDHRHYWWKIRSAQETLALYRQDITAFHTAWEALLPGRSKAALWFPDAASHALADLTAVRQAQRTGLLVPVAPGNGFALRPAELDPAHASDYQTLCPETRGLLLLLAAAYREAGGAGGLEIGDLTRPQNLSEERRKARIILPIIHMARISPPDPDAKNLPGNGPPPGFDFHTAGLAFDVIRPMDAKKRKILDYALGVLQDRQILWYYEEKDFAPARYVVVPNPRYADALKKIDTAGNIPKLFPF